MHKPAVLAMVAAVLAAGTVTRAQEPPKMPTPQKEHQWLKQFVGEWDTEAEVVMEPGKPPVKMKGTESARLVGGFWLISELKGECFGVPMTGIITVGYDTQKKKYVGTFICSAAWAREPVSSMAASKSTRQSERTTSPFRSSQTFVRGERVARPVSRVTVSTPTPRAFGKRQHNAGPDAGTTDDASVDAS